MGSIIPEDRRMGFPVREIIETLADKNSLLIFLKLCTYRKQNITPFILVIIASIVSILTPKMVARET